MQESGVTEHSSQPARTAPWSFGKCAFKACTRSLIKKGEEGQGALQDRKSRVASVWVLQFGIQCRFQVPTIWCRQGVQLEARACGRII